MSNQHPSITYKQLIPKAVLLSSLVAQGVGADNGDSNSTPTSSVAALAIIIVSAFTAQSIITALRLISPLVIISLFVAGVVLSWYRYTHVGTRTAATRTVQGAVLPIVQPSLPYRSGDAPPVIQSESYLGENHPPADGSVHQEPPPAYDGHKEPQVGKAFVNAQFTSGEATSISISGVSIPAPLPPAYARETSSPQREQEVIDC